jgi:hypothetical protein
VGHYRANCIDDTPVEFPRPGFWLVHILGTALIFMLGMRFAVRRAPLSIMAYRVMRMLKSRS